MKNLITGLFCCFHIFIFSQKGIINSLETLEEERYSFYIEIPSGKTPTILSKSREGVQFYNSNPQIQSIYSKYKVFDFVKAFPNAKTPSLKDIYYIVVDKKELVNELRTSFPENYTYSEEKEKISYLLETNDYGLVNNNEQKNLDLINAKQTWDITTGDPNVLVGISDRQPKTNHEELTGKFVGYTNTIGHSSGHGTEVAGVVAGNTNNSVGLSAIGYNISMLYTYFGGGYNQGLPNLWNLYQSGVKVINGSWYYSCSNQSQIDQDAINEMYNNGVVLVFAAGNKSTCGNSKDNPIYPASYDNVISVTSVGILDVGFANGNGTQAHWRDRVEDVIGNPNETHHLNDLVDLAAPGYLIKVPTNYLGMNYRTVWGTSSAAPHISGTVGLMFSINPNLNSKEVETILKLTSSNLDSIPENSNYIDKMGAGRLDAYKAVKMANNMAQTNGFIEIKNRDFYRDWEFELKNAPYGIKINNEKFRDDIKVDFTARNYIEIENVTLEPNSSGSIELSIDSNIPLVNKTITTKTKIKNDISFINFDNKSFTLKHFLKNGIIEELDLKNPNDPSGTIQRGKPSINFSFNDNENLLESEINGYCNTTVAKYKINDNYLEVITRGATTLSDCGADEELGYFIPVTGDYYMQNPSQKVNFEFSDDLKELTLWTNENHKLVFESKTLDVSNELFTNSVTIYPNPTNDFLNIVVSNKSFNLQQITIYDVLGNKVKTIYNKKRINISELNVGVYLIKLTSKNNLFTIKKIIKK